MTHPLGQPVTASWLAESLGRPLLGADLEIRDVASLADVGPNTLCFARRAKVPEAGPAVVIGSADLAGGALSVVVSERPRLDFARALQLLDRTVGFLRPEAPPRLHPTVAVGDGTVIGKGVEIGEDSLIGHGVVIAEGVRIGRGCRVKSGAVIGEDGFGFERDEGGRPIRIVHLGSVLIGDDVEVGSLTTICRGTLSATVIEDSVKIDDHVHVAHNCVIRKGAMIAAGAVLSGGVEVGPGAWLAPQSAVIQKVRIGQGATVGIGGIVFRHVAAGTTVFGNPARALVKASPPDDSGEDSE